MMLGSLVAVVASLSLGADVSYGARVETEARTRTLVVSRLAARTTKELDLTPRLSLGVEHRSFSYGIAYFPRLLLQDAPDTGGDTQLLNRLSLTGRWIPAPLWTIEGTTTGSYGLVDTLAPSQPTPGGTTLPTPSIQPLPNARSLKEVYGEGQLSVEHQLAPRYRLLGSVGFLVSGGADATAQQILPLQYGPRLAIDLHWNANPDDVLITSLSGSLSRSLIMGLAGSGTQYSLDRNARIVTLTETWRHALDPTSSVWLGVGAAYTHSNGTGIELTRGFHPVAEVGIRRESPVSGDGWSANVTVRMAPAVDTLTGVVLERIDATPELSWWMARDWRLDCRTSAGVVTQSGDQQGDPVFSSEARGTFVVSSQVELFAGARFLVQHQARSNPPDLVQWGGFLGVALSATRPPAPPPPQQAPENRQGPQPAQPQPESR